MTASERAHLLSHVAQNADGLGNLLTWAKTGVETPMYATSTAREEGIEAGAARSTRSPVKACCGSGCPRCRFTWSTWLSATTSGASPNCSGRSSRPS